MSACFRFQIDGEIHDSLVRELEGCWQTAMPTLSNRTLIVDLRFVTSWSAPAVELLARMYEAGAEFMALPGRSAELVELVTGIRQATPELRQNAQRWFKQATA